MTPDQSSIVSVERPTLSDEQLHKLESIERFKKMFLTTSLAGWNVASALSECDDMVRKLQEKLPQVEFFPKAMEVMVVLENFYSCAHSALEVEVLKASATEKCTFTPFCETPTLRFPLGSLYPDERNCFPLEARLEKFLELYTVIRDMNFRIDVGSRNNAKIVAFETAFSRYINGDLGDQLYDLAENRSLALSNLGNWLIENGSPRPFDSKAFLEWSEWAAQIVETHKGDLMSIHEKIRDHMLKEKAASLQMKLVEDLSRFPHHLQSALAEPAELFQRFSKEFSLNTIDSERTIAIAAVCLDSVNNTVLQTATTLVDGAITFNQGLLVMSKALDLPPAACHLYSLRALKLNRYWLIAHIGEHFLGEDHSDPRGEASDGMV